MCRLFHALALCLALAPGAALANDCRLALVLALDVSGSVNDAEYRQQIDGLAFALDSSEVRNAILADAATVDLSIFEWSSQNHQIVIQPWLTLTDDTAIDRVIARIRSHRKIRAGLKTALGTALTFAASQLSQRPFCWQKKIDVSGDGPNNIGTDPALAYRRRAFDGVTVNALVIGQPSDDRRVSTSFGMTRQDLQRYFETTVIRGPGAFAMIADGYADYGRAMQRKLLRELAVPVFGWIEHPPVTQIRWSQKSVGAPPSAFRRSTNSASSSRMP